MIKALLLIFDPTATWERIFRAQRGLWFILLVYLTPLLALTSGMEAYGLVHNGKWALDGEKFRHFTRGEVVIFEAGQFLLSLALVFVGAWLLKSIGETFHGRNTFIQAFSAVAYGLSPMFLLRLLDAYPSESWYAPWVVWSIGIILSIGVLYQGIPRMMLPDPSHAFGLFLIGSLLLMLSTGLARMVTALYLQGRLGKGEAFISELAKRLPF